MPHEFHGPARTDWDHAPSPANEPQPQLGAAAPPKQAGSIHSNVDSLWSESPRGALPYMDHLQEGESLVVVGHCDGIQADTKVLASFTSAGVTVGEVRTAGTGFTVPLLPTAVNSKLHGDLILTTGGTQIASLPIKIDVQDHAGEDKFAGRPAHVADAARFVGSATDDLYSQMAAAVTNVSVERDIKDPVEPSLVARLLQAAGEISLSIATLGVSNICTSSVENALASVGAGAMAQSLVKSGVSDTVKRSVQAAVGQVVAAGQPTGRRDGSEHPSSALNLSFYGKFAEMQSKTVNHLRGPARDEAVTESASMAERLEAREPGSGYRVLIKTRTGLQNGLGEAYAAQMRGTLQAWATYQAQAHLGVTHKDDADPDRPVGTDLAYASKAGHAISPLGPANSGVVTMQLGRVPHTDVFRPLAVVVGGISSQALLDNINTIPLRDLKMPVVARYLDPDDHTMAFSAGRNELGEYFADATYKLLEAFTGASSNEDAARLLFSQFDAEPVQAKIAR